MKNTRAQNTNLTNIKLILYERLNEKKKIVFASLKITYLLKLL